MTAVAPTEGTVAQRIRQVRHTLAPGELRVVAALTDNYPTAGLVPIAQLAAEADVSAPTALRLISKLGFHGYGAFQESLRNEVQTRLFSPVAIYPSTDTPDTGESALSEAAHLYGEGLRATLNNLSADELGQTIRALAMTESKVMIVGGRFSSVLATQLFQYLNMLRPGVELIPPTSGAHMASLIDIDTDTVVVAFDYRRYQQTTIDWGVAAAERGAQLIVITDIYLSPLASYGTSVLATSPTGLSPFDSMAHGFMLVELLISLTAKELGDPARDRLAAFEELQQAEEYNRHSARSRQPRTPTDT
jgi:DNA-binding MurR/RpiR family transcriptional regulator